MKTKVLNVLKNKVGSNNVRVELSKVYIFLPSQNAFVFFTTLIALESYKYDSKNGWTELDEALEEFSA
jgi:hypothetical protein